MWMHDKLRCAITLASDTRHGYSLLPLPTPPTHTTRRHKRFTNPHSRSFTTHAPSQEPAPLSAASRRLEVERQQEIGLCRKCRRSKSRGQRAGQQNELIPDYMLDSRMQLLLAGRLRRRRVFPASGRGRSHALLRAVGLAATVACASVVHLAYIRKFQAVGGHDSLDPPQRAVDAAEGHPVRSGARDGWWACYWQRLARCGGRRWP